MIRLLGDLGKCHPLLSPEDSSPGGAAPDAAPSGDASPAPTSQEAGGDSGLSTQSESPTSTASSPAAGIPSAPAFAFNYNGREIDQETAYYVFERGLEALRQARGREAESPSAPSPQPQPGGAAPDVQSELRKAIDELKGNFDQAERQRRGEKLMADIFKELQSVEGLKPLMSEEDNAALLRDLVLLERHNDRRHTTRTATQSVWNRLDKMLKSAQRKFVTSSVQQASNAGPAPGGAVPRTKEERGTWLDRQPGGKFYNQKREQISAILERKR